MALTTEYGTTSWCASDVLTLAPHLSEDDAEDFLAGNAKYLQDAMVTAGWEAMETLLSEEDLLRDGEKS